MPLSSVLGAQSIIKAGVCTSTTRPASPYEGQLIFETDTDRLAFYDGSAWKAVGVASTIDAKGDLLVGTADNTVGRQAVGANGTVLMADSTQTNGIKWAGAYSALSAESNTQQTGAFSSNFVYTTAAITLTPGTWIVQGQASLTNTVTGDAVAVGLWNQTTSAEINNSRGPCGLVTTTTTSQFVSRMVQITVTANTEIRVLCTRNGASTIQANSASGAPAACLNAFRVVGS